MYHWEDYLDKQFMLASSQEPTNFIRSDFDYGARQRRAVKGYQSYAAKIVLEFWELVAFKDFWALLLDGSQPFYTNMNMHGDDTFNKEVRFTSGYTLQEIGDNKYILTCSMELKRTGTSSRSVCPKVPTQIFMPDTGVTPCGIE